MQKNTYAQCRLSVYESVHYMQSQLQIHRIKILLSCCMDLEICLRNEVTEQRFVLSYQACNRYSAIL